MKVYIKYEEPEIPNGISLPEPLLNIIKGAMNDKMEKHKYRVMWQLRTLETEINDQGGAIVIEEGGRIHTKNFTQDLTDKILALLNEDKE